MKNKMLLITALLLGGFAISLSAFIATNNAAVQTVTITLGVAFYHFAMRLAVGNIVDLIMKNRADWKNSWFRERKLESKFYKLIRIRKWKKHIPTYSPDTFDAGKKNVRQLVEASCQAEIIHELIMLLSLAPIALIPFLGSAEAFVITSVLSMLIDSVFVMLQRYNRPKLVKVMERVDRLK